MRLTREQAAIIGAYTGITCGPFEDIQALGDKVMGFPTFTHMYGDRAFVEHLRETVRPQFIEICAER